MIRVTSTITLREYRAAVYFGLVMRMRRSFQAFFLCLALAAAWFLAAKLGVIGYSPILNYIAAAYLVYLLILFARTEREIARYAKSESSLLGVPIEYVFTDTTFTAEIPSRGEKSRFDVNAIAAVFEETPCFLVYLNGQQAYLLTKASMTRETIGDLRVFFSSHLKDRFSSRFFDRANASIRRRRFFG